jgi:cardiolipin synthase
MSSIDYDNIKLFDNNTDLYNSMLEDIRNAKHSIYIEMYRITKENLGKSFVDALTEASSRGIMIIGLFDAWGTGYSLSFFAPIINKGGKIKIFNKLRIIKLIKSHRRNHRKIIVIDEDISYIGSSNIANYSTEWRELTLRIKGSLSKPLKKIIKFDFKSNKNFLYLNKAHTRYIHHDGFEIIRDIPSIYKQKVKRKYQYLIKNAQ